MIEECRHWAWRRLLCLRNLNKDNSRILDEFIAVTGHHRKHGIRLLGKPDDDEGTAHSVLGRRIDDEALRAAVIVIWEAASRKCGKRLKAALPDLVDSTEPRGQLDRLLKPIRFPIDCLCKRLRRLPAMGKRIPVFTYNDWDRPPPGYLEIDLVAHCGGPLSRSFIAWSPPTSAPAGPKPFPFWPRSSPGLWTDWRPSGGGCLSTSVASTRTTIARSSTKR